MIIKVFNPQNTISVDVEIEGIALDEYKEIIAKYKSLLSSKKKADAVAEAFLYSLSICPKANPADLWWHVIYRSFLNFKQSDQSWKRTGGFALEWAFERFYNKEFEKYGIVIECLSKKEAIRVLNEMGIADKVGKSKLDVVLKGKCKDGTFRVIGGIHVKGSLAERIQDDVPASIAMMEAGYWSGFVTLDAKAFPPPHGDAIVRGELGYRTDSEGALKRNYFEKHGQFDNCYSYNLRTIPSDGETASGKKIYRLSFNDPKPDQFMRDVIERWETVKGNT